MIGQESVAEFSAKPGREEKGIEVLHPPIAQLVTEVREHGKFDPPDMGKLWAEAKAGDPCSKHELCTTLFLLAASLMSVKCPNWRLDTQTLELLGPLIKDVISRESLDDAWFEFCLELSAHLSRIGTSYNIGSSQAGRLHSVDSVSGC